MIGDIKRFQKFYSPVLLIYDIEDKGHPIEQGKLMARTAPNSMIHTFRGSQEEYWVCDNLWDKMLFFFKYGQGRKPQNRASRRDLSMNHRATRSI